MPRSPEHQYQITTEFLEAFGTCLFSRPSAFHGRTNLRELAKQIAGLPLERIGPLGSVLQGSASQALAGCAQQLSCTGLLAPAAQEESEDDGQFLVACKILDPPAITFGLIRTQFTH